MSWLPNWNFAKCTLVTSTSSCDICLAVISLYVQILLADRTNGYAFPVNSRGKSGVSFWGKSGVSFWGGGRCVPPYPPHPLTKKLYIGRQHSVILATAGFLVCLESVLRTRLQIVDGYYREIQSSASGILVFSLVYNGSVKSSPALKWYIGQWAADNDAIATKTNAAIHQYCILCRTVINSISSSSSSSSCLTTQ